MFRFLKPSETNHIFTDRITPPQFFVWLSIFGIFGPTPVAQIKPIFREETAIRFIHLINRIVQCFRIIKIRLKGRKRISAAQVETIP